MGSCEDKALLVSLDTFRCPNLAFNIVDGVRSFCHEGDSLPREDLDEDLHPCSLSTSVVQLPGGRCCA